MKVKNVAINTLVTAPYTLYQTAFLVWIITGDSKYLFFLVLMAIFGSYANKAEKKFAEQFFGKHSIIGSRPSGCGIRVEQMCTGCGIYPEFGKTSTSYGMPSGHAQITAFAATYWTVYLLSKNKTSKEPNCYTYPRIFVLWLLVFLVAGERVMSGCHTILQVIVGVCIGIFFGIIGYYISTLVYKKLPKIN